MGTFNYRALTEDGRIVSNKVEEGNRLTLVKKLKENGLYPISIVQRNAQKTKVLKRKKRNVSNIQNVLDKVNTTVVLNDNRRKLSLKDKINDLKKEKEKITLPQISVTYEKDGGIIKENSNLNHHYVCNWNKKVILIGKQYEKMH